MTGPHPGQRLCELHVPRLDVPRASAHVRARPLERNVEITDVLATRPATLLIVYRGEEQVEAWAAALEPLISLPAHGRDGTTSSG